MTTKEKLIARAADTTREWIKENWSRHIGNEESILENLIQYDDEFSELWDEFCDDHGWEEGDTIDENHPDYQELLSFIRETQEAYSDPVNVIGREVREARDNQGLSIRDLSARTGVNISNLSKIENGLHDPRVSTISRIADALGGTLSLNIPLKMKYVIKGRRHGADASTARTLHEFGTLEEAKKAFAEYVILDEAPYIFGGDCTPDILYTECDRDEYIQDLMRGLEDDEEAMAAYASGLEPLKAATLPLLVNETEFEEIDLTRCYGDREFYWIDEVPMTREDRI